MPLGSSPAFLHEDEEVDGRTMKYLPIDSLYSSTSPCINPSGSSSVMSKKVKARKLIEEEDEEEEEEEEKEEKMMAKKETFLLVYRRRNKKKPRPCDERSEGDHHHHQSGGDSTKKAKKNYELLSLDSSGISGPRHLRRSGGLSRKGKESDIGRKGRCPGSSKESSSAFSRTQRWVELDFEGVEPNVFVGMACKVFWPIDDNWYKGSVTGYNSVTRKHCIEYNDGDLEHLSLTDEKIKFHLSTEEIQHWNLKYDVSSREKNGLNYNEMLALAASFDDCQDLEPGDLVWAKLTGHAMWPAVIVDESNIAERGVLQLVRHNQSVLVQFFGTHDFARINSKQAIPFLNGLLSSLHLKCKQTRFYRSLEEAKEYLRDQQLPETMLQMRKSNSAEGSWNYSREQEERIYSCEDHGEEMMQKTVECNSILPLEIGDLRVTSLGEVVCNSMHFHDKKHIWPEGYTAFRTFKSVRDPSMETSYKMEVLRNPKVKSRPLFRVTSDDGQQIDGPNPSACWKEIYERIRQSQNNLSAEAQLLDVQSPGSEMFGFKNPKVAELIQDLPNARFCSKYFKSCGDVPEGFRAVHVDWNDLDRCSVCNNDEEYEDNLFLQCDKCRMMVHARCYGELESLDGVLWFCNLCRPGAPKSPPRCCLCPVIGGALKPTTDGRWAHLACAMWIPETCLVDVKRMEPIDGLARINKDRWKLLCSICTVGYGACIQCSHSTCRVAYHPLCARAAGLCVELEDEDGTHLMSFEEDGQCIRLLSFCKKHRQTGNDGKQVDENVALLDQCASKYVPASNTSGCARTEPYNFFGRRGRKEPQVLAAASMKRLFVENMPHLVRDYYQNGINLGFHGDESQQLLVPGDSKGGIQHVASASISSMAEKYHNMKITFRKRLAFGKSSIHGFGVFAKLPHKAGDMVIEYIGEVVRPPIADIRERCIYNSLVGAGTYMFRLDSERVIDATKAGSIAHLINHSCEPNCFSRIITVKDDLHIIIFAKRDINIGQELTYDYRFSSEDERLVCYCGSQRCRGVVNDIESDEQRAKSFVS